MGFYIHFRWLALIGKLTGIFPVQNVLSRDAFKLTYRAFSFSSAYSIIVYTSFLVVQYMTFGFHFTVKTSYHQLILALIYSMLARSIVSFGFCLHHHAKHVPKLIKLLETFDRQQSKKLKQIWHGKLFKVSARIICPTVLHVALASLYFQMSSQLIRQLYESRDGLNWGSICFGVLSIWHIVPPLHFMYFGIKISIGFEQINDTLVARGYYCNYFSNDVKFDSSMGDALSDLRLLHNLLSEATHALSRCYGGFIWINHIFLIVAVVVNISAYLCATRDLSLLLVTCIDVFYYVSLLIISSIIKKRGAKVARLFQGIPTSALSEKSKEEIQLWLLQLSVHPVQVNAAGYFILDKSQSFEVLSSIATYLIVAVQLLQEEKSSGT